MLRLPTIRGVIDRRILVNFRVDPAVAARVLPAPFRPKLAGGFAIGGICLIRLKQIRPKFLPIHAGIASENAAHRFAVEWDDGDGPREGVYIPRRDSSSRLNALAGGRIFPGEHHHARFEVNESAERLSVRYASDDGAVSVSVVAAVSNRLEGSVFNSIEAASRFFEAGSLGYSATADSGRFDGIELRCDRWHVEPLAVESVHSSHFEDSALFPAGSATLDCALLMRGIEHEWRGREDLCCGTQVHASPRA